MNGRSQRVIQLDPAVWKHPALKVSSARTRAHLVDLVWIMQTAPRPGRLVDPAGESLDVERLATIIGADAGELQDDIDALVRIGVLSRDTAGGLYSAEMVRRAELSAKRRQAGLRGGNPALKTMAEPDGKEVAR